MKAHRIDLFLNLHKILVLFLKKMVDVDILQGLL